MPVLSRAAKQVLQHPTAFVRRTLKSFWANQGMLLAGAIAYYTLLSLVPLLALSVSALSHWVEQKQLLNTLGRYVEWLVPSQSQALLGEVSNILANQIAIDLFLLVTMLFFSSLAFSVLQKAMAVIFAHRNAEEKRHSLVSIMLPYGFVVLLGIALLGITAVSTTLQTLAHASVHVMGRDWSLRGLSGLLLHLLGLSAVTLLLTSIYLVMPVGRTRLRHALIGGVTAATTWEIIRHILIWYLAKLSNASVLYGSLTTAVVALFSLEIAATLLLLGAQVISEYERLAANKRVGSAGSNATAGVV